MSLSNCPHPRTAEHGRTTEYERPTAAGGKRLQRSWLCNTCKSARAKKRRAEQAEQRHEEAVLLSLEEDMAHLYEVNILNEEWREQAQCQRASDMQGFISTDTQLQKDAKRICGYCPVKQQCLESALSMPWFEGVAGGESLRSNQFTVDPDRGMPYIVRDGKRATA